MKVLMREQTRAPINALGKYPLAEVDLSLHKPIWWSQSWRLSPARRDKGLVDRWLP